MQHFLLSAAARTLSLKAVFRMGEDRLTRRSASCAGPRRKARRFARAAAVPDYNITTRRRFKCVGCHHQFSVTSGTIFASRKLSFTDLLAAIVIFVNGAKGVSALQVSRDLDVQYKTAFVLSHKLREAMAREQARPPAQRQRRDRRRLFRRPCQAGEQGRGSQGPSPESEPIGKRQCVVIMRERGGRTLPFVVRSEGDAVPIVRDRVGTSPPSTPTKARGWDALHAGWDTRPRQSQRRVHGRRRLHQSGRKLFLAPAPHGSRHAPPYRRPVSAAYAGEVSWREDNRRVRTAIRRAWLRARRWLRRLAGLGPVIGSGLSSVGHCAVR